MSAKKQKSDSERIAELEKLVAEMRRLMAANGWSMP
jgi:hypothetical protein